MQKKEKFLFCETCKKWTTHIQLNGRGPFVCEVENSKSELQKLLKEFLQKDQGNRSVAMHEFGLSVPILEDWILGKAPSEHMVKHAIKFLKAKLNKK